MDLHVKKRQCLIESIVSLIFCYILIYFHFKDKTYFLIAGIIVFIIYTVTISILKKKKIWYKSQSYSIIIAIIVNLFFVKLFFMANDGDISVGIFLLLFTLFFIISTYREYTRLN